MTKEKNLEGAMVVGLYLANARVASRHHRQLARQVGLPIIPGCTITKAWRYKRGPAITTMRGVA